MVKQLSESSFSPRSGSATLWEDTLKNLDQQVGIYHAATAKGDQHDIDQATERITMAMRDAIESHPDPNVRKEWKKKRGKLEKMKFLGDKDSMGENPFKQMSRGFLTILTTPIALVGAGLYGVGLMVEGSAAILKGMGSLGTRIFVPPRRRNSA